MQLVQMTEEMDKLKLAKANVEQDLNNKIDQYLELEQNYKNLEEKYKKELEEVNNKNLQV